MSKLVQKTSEEINNCREAQAKYCAEKGHPHFAPGSGICWKCNRNIYQNYETNGRISAGKTGESLVTGCPHCYRSYCD